jgi:hypothetical protein
MQLATSLVAGGWYCGDHIKSLNFYCNDPQRSVGLQACQSSLACGMYMQALLSWPSGQCHLARQMQRPKVHSMQHTRAINAITYLWYVL